MEKVKAKREEMEEEARKKEELQSLQMIESTIKVSGRVLVVMYTQNFSIMLKTNENQFFFPNRWKTRRKMRK